MKKEEKHRLRLEAAEKSRIYRTARAISNLMDRYGIDPIIGLIPGGVGDIIAALIAIPFIYISVWKLRSMPLTLAIIYNILTDVLIGMIPFYIGNIIDFFNKSNTKNAALLQGYLENDTQIIGTINGKATRMAVLIAAAVVAIIGLLALQVKLAELIGDSLCRIF